MGWRSQPISNCSRHPAFILGAWGAARSAWAVASGFALALPWPIEALSLIPQGMRAAAHLQIGRLLVAHTPPEQREEAIAGTLAYMAPEQTGRMKRPIEPALLRRKTGARKRSC